MKCATCNNTAGQATSPYCGPCAERLADAQERDRLRDAVMAGTDPEAIRDAVLWLLDRVSP